jgi:hypothetical protein
VSDRIEDLLRPPVDSSPRPSLMYRPRSITRATSASARALTTAARSLRSRPSERSGCARNRVSVTTTPEHRVAEELQPLVGGQAAVLVGERPVRQGAARACRRPGQDGRVPREGPRRTLVPMPVRLASSGHQEFVRGPGDGRRGRRTDRTAGRPGAGGAWNHKPGWHTSPATARRPSTASDGGACCCATSSASGQPRCSP